MTRELGGRVPGGGVVTCGQGMCDEISQAADDEDHQPEPSEQWQAAEQGPCAFYREHAQVIQDRLRAVKPCASMSFL